MKFRPPLGEGTQCCRLIDVKHEKSGIFMKKNVVKSEEKCSWPVVSCSSTGRVM
jgi:hypothetical protein